MKQIVLDFESYYDQDYSLRKMTPVEYILDPRFELIGCAVKEGHGKSFWLTEPELITYLAGLPEKVVLISHNALFDMSLLAWRYDYVPTLMVDTMGLARAWYGHKLRSVALSMVAAFLGVGAKGTTVHKVQGMGLAAIKAAGFYEEYAQYSLNDADLCWQIYRKIVDEGFPANEIMVMDTVLRCAVKPKFVLNQTLLAEHLHATLEAKAALLAKCGVVTKADLMSNDKFADALRGLGVEPPRKISLTTGLETYAFAKTDYEFIDLEEHDNPDVQALVSARLGIKSTIEETRTVRLQAIANLTWRGSLAGHKGLLPVPLRYSGAHTHRLSGDWKLNCMHPDIEVLTTKGWQKIADWEPTTPIMQWWPDGRLDFDPRATKMQRIETKELIWFDAPFVKGGFTRDHRMVHFNGGRLTERTAGWIADHSGLDNIPTTGVYSGGAAPITVAQVRLLVALAADGSCLYVSGPRKGSQKRGSVKSGGWQWGFHKSRKVDRLRALLQAAGVKFTEWSGTKRTNFCVKEKDTPVWLVKGFGAWCLDLSADAMDALLGEVIYWDGFENSRSKQTTFVTSIKEQAEWVQTVAHLRGVAATVRCYTKKTNFGVCDQHYVYFRQGKLTSVGKTQKTAVPYSGIVYCPTVASSYVIVRHGQGVFITGQCQNLPSRGNNKLRMAIEAPPGHKVVAADASQIEARIGAWFSGEQGMVSQFRDKEDVYSTFASAAFGRPVSKKTDPEARWLGKVAVLGLGFQMGWPKFQGSVATLSQAQLGEELKLSDDEALKIVNTYRSTYKAIPAMWRTLQGLIPQMTSRGFECELGPVKFLHQRIRLPSGLYLHYHDLQNVDGQWMFTYGGKPKKVYSGLMLENIVQALARIVTMDAAVRIRGRLKELGLAKTVWLNLQVHDELIFVVEDELVSTVEDLMLQEMRVPPSWGTDIPLDAESGVGQSFGDT